MTLFLQLGLYPNPPKKIIAKTIIFLGVVNNCLYVYLHWLGYYYINRVITCRRLGSEKY